jgi:hypothetical protein
MLSNSTARAQQHARRSIKGKSVSAPTPAQQGAEAVPAPGSTDVLPLTQQLAQDQQLAQVPERSETETEEPARRKPTLEINGFAMLDAIYDFNRVAPEWAATLRPSRIPVPNTLPNGQTIFSIRQSRLNFLGTLPSSMGDIKTRFEFDLFGVGPDEGQTTMRVRHVYGEVGSWLFGQTNSVFMDGDVFPNTVDYWGPAGMVFFRTVQVRWTGLNKNGRSVRLSLEGPGSAVDTGKIDQFDPTLGLRARNQWPDVAANFRQDAPWGHVQLAGIVRNHGYESATSPDGEPSGDKTGGGVSLGGTVKVLKKDKIYAQLTWGRGIANYMNDGGSDLAPDSNLRAITLETVAGEFYYEHPWNDKWVSSIGYSQHTQDNSGGQTPDAFHKGQYLSANLLYTPAPDILMGVEYLWGERQNNNGRAGVDNRVQFTFKYNFRN